MTDKKKTTKKPAVKKVISTIKAVPSKTVEIKQKNNKLIIDIVIDKIIYLSKNEKCFTASSNEYNKEFRLGLTNKEYLITEEEYNTIKKEIK